MKCVKCGYEWDSRVQAPKACPRCKSRQDTKESLKAIKEAFKDGQEQD